MTQRDGALIISEHVLQGHLERATAQLRELTEKAQNLADALVIAGERVPTRKVPDDVVGKDLVLERFDIALAEGLISFVFVAEYVDR